MIYVISLIDGVVFGFLNGYHQDSFWVGLFTVFLTLIVAGSLTKVSQLIFAGIWAYLLYTWMIPSQTVYKVIGIIALITVIRFLITWLHIKYDKDFQQMPIASINDDPITESMESMPMPLAEPVDTVPQEEVIKPVLYHGNNSRVVNMHEWVKKRGKRY